MVSTTTSRSTSKSGPQPPPSSPVSRQSTPPPPPPPTFLHRPDAPSPAPRRLSCDGSSPAALATFLSPPGWASTSAAVVRNSASLPPPPRPDAHLPVDGSGRSCPCRDCRRRGRGADAADPRVLHRAGRPTFLRRPPRLSLSDDHMLPLGAAPRLPRTEVTVALSSPDPVSPPWTSHPQIW
ncbi:hypothetical protein VPH35_123263 [Triticum aestivum]